MDYDTRHDNDSSAVGAKLCVSDNIWCLSQIVKFDKLSYSDNPEQAILIKLIYSPGGIYINMIIYKPYTIDAAWCSILTHQMRQSN
jgi:hypothetical protein